jgi:hypothetical protein
VEHGLVESFEAGCLQGRHAVESGLRADLQNGDPPPPTLVE